MIDWLMANIHPAGDVSALLYNNRTQNRRGPLVPVPKDRLHKTVFFGKI